MVECFSFSRRIEAVLLDFPRTVTDFGPDHRCAQRSYANFLRSHRPTHAPALPGNLDPLTPVGLARRLAMLPARLASSSTLCHRSDPSLFCPPWPAQGAPRPATRSDRQLVKLPGCHRAPMPAVGVLCRLQHPLLPLRPEPILPPVAGPGGTRVGKPNLSIGQVAIERQIPGWRAMPGPPVIPRRPRPAQAWVGWLWPMPRLATTGAGTKAGSSLPGPLVTDRLQGKRVVLGRVAVCPV